MYLCAVLGTSQVVLVVKNLPANAGDAKDSGSISGSGRSLGVGSGKPFQYSYLENFMDKQAWQATVHGTTESQTPPSCVECTAVQTWKPWLLTVPSWKWGRIRLQVQRERSFENQLWTRSGNQRWVWLWRAQLRVWGMNLMIKHFVWHFLKTFSKASYPKWG